MTRRSVLAVAVPFAALFVVQVAPSAAIAWRQAQRLATGRPVLLAVETRDPRDLFRGEYSTLAYEVGRPVGVPADADGSECDLVRRESCRIGNGRPIYVRLVPDAAGIHRATEVRFVRPERGEFAGDVFLAGRTQAGTLARAGAKAAGLGGEVVCGATPCFTGQVLYGIETWYGAQGRPRRLDAAARKDVLVEARVDAEGAAVLDVVRVGGEVFARTARPLPWGGS